MKVAIHQPNYLPWIGLFARIARVDRFVLFDHVQAMGGKSWLSRNRVLVGGEARWMTMPTHKSGRLGQRVREVRINYVNDVARKHLRTLRLNYGRCPHGERYLELMEDLYARRYERLMDFNVAFIRAVCADLGLETELVFSTNLVADNPRLEGLKGNEQVLSTCEAAGGTSYLSGDGCRDFIEPSRFTERGIDFRFQQFLHPRYAQLGPREFVANLSILDALCNVGAEGVREFLRP